MYSERNIMSYTLNCLVLGQPISKIFSVFYGDYFTIGVIHVKFEELTVAGFKEVLFERSGITEMNVWKVNLKGHEIKNISTEDDIKNLEDSEKIDDNPMLNFETYYSNVDDDKKPKKEYLHIFIVPTTTETLSMVLEKMLKGVARSSNKTPGFSNSIPLKERDMESAIMSISKNFEQSFYNEQSVAKSTLQFLVCCGAPGIGKTRYGVELFNHLKNNPGVLKDPHSSPVPNPDFLSIYLDFGADVELDCFDNHLTADTAIALRIAFKFFVNESYQMNFNGFRQNVYALFNVDGSVESLRKLESIMNLNNVIQSIRNSRQLTDNRTLFIFLHIDEIQVMFNYEKYWIREVQSSSDCKGFTKRILHTLAQYMMNNKTFIQTFLSGTALQDVVKLKEPTGYNFNYNNCPLLSMGACIEIVNDFAVKENDTNYRWTLDRSFIKILDDARGLPRAIEYILERILKTNFFKNHTWNPSGFFAKIAEALDNSYAITRFVEKNKNLALALLKNCMKNDSINRTDKVLKNDVNSLLTYEELERDQHIILEDDNGKLLIAMPVYFIFIYNQTLNLADNALSEALMGNLRNMEWQHWEIFVAHFEMFKVNLLASGKTTAKLNELYLGAFGNKKTLSLEFKLRNLEAVAYLEHKFPLKYEDLGCKYSFIPYTWKDAIVFKNAASAEFGDSFVRYVSADDDYGYLFCLQCKWIWGNDFQTPLKLADIIGEHSKNLATLKKYGSEEIKKERIITIMFTTRAIDPDLTYSFSSAIPDNILVVCRDNFHKHFGRLFASRLDFELLSVNANFTHPDTLKNIFGTAIKDTPRDLKLKRPFHSPEDFKNRVAFNDGVTLDSDGEIITKICRLSYAPFQKRKGSQIQELPVFERRVSPRLADEKERTNYYNLG